MKALTLWQPWASLVALGPEVKPHETRGWATSYRGPLLIHAAARRDTGTMRASDRARLTLIRSGLSPRLPPQLPFGSVVAVAELTDCSPTDGLYGTEPDHDLDAAFGDWSPGRWAWELSRVRPLPEPVRWQGAQGLWYPQTDLVEKVESQLRRIAS